MAAGGMGTPLAIGLDFGAALAFAAASGADSDLVSTVLPDVETAIVARINRDLGSNGDE